MNARESEEKLKQAEENKRKKEILEKEKQEKIELEKIRKEKQNSKGKMQVRSLNQKLGVVLVNGKERKYHDWSTSPHPSFFNKEEWKS